MRKVFKPNKLQITRIDIVFKTLVYSKQTGWELDSIDLEPKVNSTEVIVYLRLIDKDNNKLCYIINTYGGYSFEE